MRLFTCLMLLAALAAAPLHAQTNDPDAPANDAATQAAEATRPGPDEAPAAPYRGGPRATVWGQPFGASIGVGGGYRRSIYKDWDGSEFSGFPAVRLTLGDFYLAPPAVGWRHGLENDLALDLNLRWRMDGYDADDSPAFAGMDDRDGTLEGGIGLLWTPRPWRGEFTAHTDLIGEHDGQELGLSFGRSLPSGLEDLGLSAEAGVTWQSANLADYYYGVRPHEATAGRPAYEVGDAFNYHLGLGARYRLGQRSALFAGVRWTLFDNRIADSPIVAHDHTFGFRAGAMYRF